MLCMPRGYVEAVALFHFVVVYRIADGIGLHQGLVVCGRDALVEAYHHVGIGRGIHDVPHFGLAPLVTLAPCALVVGVYLYREVAGCVDELYEQRELVAEAGIVLPAQQPVFQRGHELVGGQAVVRASGNGRLMPFHAGYLPALANLAQFAVQLLEGDNPVASPDGLFQ